MSAPASGSPLSRDAVASHPLQEGVPVDSPSTSEPQTPVKEATFPSSFRRRAIGEVPGSLEGVAQLAREGAWRSILVKFKERAEAGPPAEQLVWQTWNVLALVKLRMYGAAADELRSIGDISSPRFRYEEHPGEYPERSGSFVPFALRWLHAELPHRLGQAGATMDRLYSLLELCKVEVARRSAAVPGGAALLAGDNAAPGDWLAASDVGVSGREDFLTGELAGLSISGERPETDSTGLLGDADASSGAPPSTSGAAEVRTWRRRQEVVLLSILNLHLQQRDFAAALSWLHALLRQRGKDPHVWAMLGCVQLQMGDLEAARATFTRSEQLMGDAAQSSLLLHRNRGLLHFALKNYSAALEEWDLILVAQPWNAVAANNKALCLMYSRDLVGAIAVLERTLREHPLQALNETLVLNLASMYELASSNAAELKRTLSAWISKIAPDDFDILCTRT
ncbi:hypothetical protein KFL_004220080 [Klebsormidium nitens]|uniref:Uncharacterized protein n=1 Tax=Klebsormidium nitens TaxID=105231 RepID=A0A1Y1IFU5_KLENI|nr:hypothetical protein KFL_004220080 [Klebsormidium nitens]|eukprot:GAQ88369.1 hypothetical protein KFL_004220080 [Klebsormidium nitens]